jgi:hypothetical protein
LAIASGTWLTRSPQEKAAAHMSHTRTGKRGSWSRIWTIAGITYCVAFFLNLAIFVLRYGYLDTMNPRIDADVIVWQIPAVPFGLAVTGAVLNAFWLPARRLAGALARLGEAMRNPRLVLEFFRQVSDGSSLARCMIWQASLFLPSRYRARYQSEWLAELDYLRSQGHRYTRWASGVLGSAPWTGLVLRGRLWSMSPIWQRLCRLEPLWNGLVTGLAVFSIIAVGFFPRDGEPPDRRQALCATIAALLSGGVSGGFAWKEQKRNKKVALERDGY